MRILFISAEYPPETGWGGIGSYVAEMAPALASRGHEVHVLSCAANQPISDQLRDGVSIHRRGLRRVRGLGRLWLYSHQFADRLIFGISTFSEYRKLAPVFDVVEYPEWNAEGWVFALLGTRPKVAHLHTPRAVFASVEGCPNSKDLRLASWLERLSAKRADLITSPSHLLAETAKSIGWVDGPRVTVVRYPLDGTQWQGTPLAGKSPPIVQFCGRIEQHKAPEILIDAANLLRPEVPGVLARFAGKIYSHPSTGLPAVPWTHPRDLGNCQFLGQIDRHALKGVLASARVFAQPSPFENFSMAALEAMAAGRPVVVTERSGVAELVRSGGGGTVVPAYDPRALADALRPFLENPDYATEVGERARQIVRTELDPGRIAELRQRVYESAIASFQTRRTPFSPRRVNTMSSASSN